MSITTDEVVELHFPIQGRRLPADHAYHLYSALARCKPGLHESVPIAIQTVKGTRDGKGFICLSEDVKLKIRLPANVIPQIYSLAGKQLAVRDCSIILGAPTISTLSPSRLLWSRLVLIKSANSVRTDSPSFIESAKKQLEQLDINAKFYLEPSAAISEQERFARRVVKIKGATLAGYGVYVDGLSDDDSLRLQAVGLGGRRKMGCGIFVPVKSSK